MGNKNKSIGVWVCVNKNGNVVMFASQPYRSDEGKWKSNNPFVNSNFYKQMQDLIIKAGMTWESEPEYFELSF